MIRLRIFFVWGILALIWSGGTSATLIIATPSQCQELLFVRDDLSVLRELWPTLSVEQKQAHRRTQMLQRDRQANGRIERRIKMLVTGRRQDAVDSIDPADRRIDFADPSLTAPISYPDGTTKYRINASGHRYIEADRPQDFFHGGIFKVQRARGFYHDGTEMKGPYHSEAWPWDVVTYRNSRGEWIALGGVMKQPFTNFLPNVAEHNRSRSRWYGTVEHVPSGPHSFEERIHWQGPIHDFNRPTDVSWVYHNYGGTLLTRWNPQTRLHEPVRLANGNFLLFYERVTEQRVTSLGHKVPYMTTLFAREIAQSLTRTVGPEVLVFDPRSPVSGRWFEALRRHGEAPDQGYLAEGGNAFLAPGDQPILAFSGNDYVGQYGVFLAYLPKGHDPKAQFRPVIDEHGELIDFATTMRLRELVHGTWLGRPQLERDPDEELWMKFHFVPKESIPAGAPIQGWPSAKDFLEYGRVTAMAPVRLVFDERKQPRLELDVDPQFKFIFE